MSAEQMPFPAYAPQATRDDFPIADPLPNAGRRPPRGPSRCARRAVRFRMPIGPRRGSFALVAAALRGAGLAGAERTNTAGYRLDDDTRQARLRTICAYRAAGLPLSAIRDVLASEGDAAARILEAHLLALTDEIARLKRRHHAIATRLAQPAFRQRQRSGKSAWGALPRRSGFDDDDMERWRAAFETEDPMRSLGLAREEMKAIRQRAASG
ncbi:MerR family DNA-binding protein [Burkholderia dolosa]|uniref:MerR family DNA-binding protein n=1 Tax=Burkholderia dolosa TaxID=152500 RepID=UPI0027D28028|nr:MerR family DNA-binding protein [Burkholderia dolosa]